MSDSHHGAVQEEDGSWHLVTRANPRQLYFEGGFPQGKDLFVSTYATGWTTKALLLAIHECKIHEFSVESDLSTSLGLGVQYSRIPKILHSQLR